MIAESIQGIGATIDAMTSRMKKSVAEAPERETIEAIGKTIKRIVSRIHATPARHRRLRKGRRISGRLGRKTPVARIKISVWGRKATTATKRGIAKDDAGRNSGMNGLPKTLQRRTKIDRNQANRRNYRPNNDLGLNRHPSTSRWRDGGNRS